MKRILSLFIVLVLMLGTLASCELPFFTKPSGSTEPTKPVAEEANIQDVVDYLEEMYGEDKNGTSTSNDFTLPSALDMAADGSDEVTEFTIVWTSSTDKVTLTLNEEQYNYLVQVPANNDTTETYTLTAKITSPKGQEATVEITRVLTASYGMITNPVAGQAYKFALLHGNEKAVVYFDGNNYNNYAWYLAYTQDVLAAVDVYLEEVEDVEGGYRLYFDLNGVKTYIVAFPRDGDTTKGTLKLDSAVPTEYYTYSSEYNTLIYTSVTGEQFYIGSSGTYKSISLSSIDYITGATSYVAHLYGPGGIVEELPEQDLPTVPENYTSEDVVNALYQLESGQTLEGPYLITGVVTSIKYAYDPGYDNVSVVIQVGDLADKPVLLYRIKGEGADTVKVGDTITVRSGVTNYNGTFETVQGGFIEEIIPGEGGGDTPVVPPVTDATEMTIPEVLAATEGTKVIVKGTVKSFYYAWDDSYGNCSVYIVDDAGNELLCFRLETKVNVGDQITVTGNVTAYNGVNQLAQGCTAVIDVPAGGGNTDDDYASVVVDTPYYLHMVLPSGTVYFKGAMDGNYLATTTDKSLAVAIYFEEVTGGYHIYFMDGETKTYITAAAYLKSNGYAGCHFSLTTETPTLAWTYNTTYGIIEIYDEVDGKSDTFFAGTYGTYNTISLSGAYYKDQISSGTQYPARLEAVEGGEVTPPVEGGDDTHEHSYVDGKCECGETDPNYVPPSEGGDDDGLMSIPEVLDAAEGTVVTFTGTVHSFYEEWSSYNNCSPYIVDDAGNKILVFRTTTKVTIGDVVTVTGTVTLYNNVNQIAKDTSTITIDVPHVCSSWTEPTCGKDSACTVCGAAGEAKATGNHTFVDGICSVCGSSAASLKLAATLSFSNVSNRTTYTTSQQIWVANGITVTNNKGSSTSNVGDYYNPARFYKSSQLIVEYSGIMQIVFTCNSASYATALVNSLDGVNYSVDGSKVTITFAEAVNSFEIASLTGGQVRVNSIDVYVAE